MSRHRRLVPLLLLAVLAWSLSTLPARAQTQAARFAFADTTLLRDTMDLHFVQLFPLADSLHVLPDSLRAFSIRYDLALERLVVLADSLHMPVDSVGPVLLREQFNPLSRRVANTTSFSYSSSYNITRQSTSWGNNVSYDLSHGPALLHNVTSVRIDRIPELGRTSFNRSKTASTELGWKVLSDVAMGMRVQMQRNESFRLGSQRTTSLNDFQGSLRSKHDFGRSRDVSLNLFGGPFNDPSASINNASKRGFGTNAEGRVNYSPDGWYSLSFGGNGTYRIGRAAVPKRMKFDTRDLTWASDGAFSLLPRSWASLRVTSTLNHNQTQRPTSFTRVTPVAGSTTLDTTIVDQLIKEPSGEASLETALQLQANAQTSLTVTGDLGRTTRLLATEQKDGVTFDQQISDELSLAVDGQMALAGWSLDGHMTAAAPQDEGPQRTVVSVTNASGGLDAVTVAYRERSKTRTRTLNGSISRRLTSKLGFKARGDLGLSSYRYAITDNSYLAATGNVQVATSDPHDDARQSLRLELNYTASSDFSSTMALETGRTLTIYLRSDRSGTNREDRVYRADWSWTYRLMTGLTANQRNQLSATYNRNIFAPQSDRLSMGYTTVTTLNARITPRLTIDLTHNTNYSPNGSYLHYPGGPDSLVLSDASRQYALSGTIAYSPMPSLTLNLQPSYTADFRDDRSRGGSVPTLRRRQLGLSGGSIVNVRVAGAGRLSGSISRNLDSRRDIPYSGGLPQPQPRSESDYWSGQLQLSWSLK